MILMQVVLQARDTLMRNSDGTMKLFIMEVKVAHPKELMLEDTSGKLMQMLLNQSIRITRCFL